MHACSDDLIQLHLGEAPPQAGAGAFDLDAFMVEERGKDLLRFSTAGSVDDGKSTLIGRLLYDTKNVYEDQVRSIEGKGSAGEGQLDLALLTDGLRAEREQGITIDVAYRYFSTARRKFIIADTPGHEQYTRNMATGASTADVAIVLVDARKGVLVQSRRHAYIAALLGVPHVIVAINKMDLVGYAEESYARIRADFAEFFGSLEEHGGSRLHYVPVSALAGDNVVRASARMPWYSGPTLLGLLESIPSTESLEGAPFRFSVQRVLRPNQNFRGFAGQIAAGVVRPGDEVLVLPSQRRSRVRSIVTFDGELRQATAPLSVCLTLEDEIDISRGDMLVAPERAASVARNFTASLVWMDERPLEPGRRYLLKHASRSVSSIVRGLRYSVDVRDLSRSAATTLAMNGIALVEMETQQPLTLDLYAANRQTGSFVLIDAESHATVAAGMVREIVESFGNAHLQQGPVRPEERRARWGHAGAHVALTGSIAFADAVERALFEVGAAVFRCKPGDVGVVQAIVAGGGISLSLEPAGQARVGIGEYVTAVDTDGVESVSAVIAVLRERGVLHALDAFAGGPSVEGVGQ